MGEHRGQAGMMILRTRHRGGQKLPVLVICNCRCLKRRAQKVVFEVGEHNMYQR